jgi:hypothetical protein
MTRHRRRASWVRPILDDSGDASPLTIFLTILTSVLVAVILSAVITGVILRLWY